MGSFFYSFFSLGMGQDFVAKNEQKVTTDFVVGSLSQMRKEFIDNICLEQSVLQYDIVPELYEYCWNKFEQKVLKDPRLLFCLMKEFASFESVRAGKRVDTVLNKYQEYQLIHEFFMLVFKVAQCYVEVNKDTLASAPLLSTSFFIKEIDLLINQRSPWCDIVSLTYESRDEMLTCLFSVLQGKKMQILIEDRQKKIEQKALLDHAKRLEDLQKKHAAEMLLLLYKAYGIPKGFKGSQEEAFELMKDVLFAQEASERKAIKMSGADKYKKQLSKIYELLYHEGIGTDLEGEKREIRELFNNFLEMERLFLERELIKEAMSEAQKIKDFAQEVLEPNAKMSELIRLKKEQRFSFDDELTQEKILDVVASGVFVDEPQNQEVFKGQKEHKELLRNARMQRRIVKREQREIEARSLISKKEQMAPSFIVWLKNKNARYAIGRKEAVCQTENVEKCLCSQKQMLDFSYSIWANVAVGAECPCLACCGLRKILNDSGQGIVSAQMMTQELSLSSDRALSLYNQFGAMSKNCVSL